MVLRQLSLGVDLTLLLASLALYLLLISPLIYLIVSLVVGKKVTLVVPLCAHMSRFEGSDSGLGWLLLIACIPLPDRNGRLYVGNDAASTLAVCGLGIALFLCGIGLLLAARPFRATHIGQASAEFSGACLDALHAMEQAPVLRLRNPTTKVEFSAFWVLLR